MNLRYVLTGVVRRHLPAPLLFRIMRLRGDGNSAAANPDEAMAAWRAQLDQHGITLAGRHVLELGSGQYARQALRMLALGARRVTMVDLYAVPTVDPAHLRLLRADCALLGLDLAEALARITVHTGDFLSLPLPTEADRPDLATSIAVLEHVQDPGAILARCYAWLAPGGQTFHLVDLRDHNLQFSQPFEMLTYSEGFWQRWLNQPGGFHLNRWRAPDYVEAITRAGFTAVACESTLTDPEGLQAVQHRLHRRFRRYEAVQLAVQGIALLGHRPPAGEPVS